MSVFIDRKKKKKVLFFAFALICLLALPLGNIFAQSIIGGFFGDTIDLPNISLPNIDKATGGFIYDYPFTLPPGRNGLNPDLKLQYSSQDDNQASLFGYGWSINIPYITRYNKTGIDKLYEDNYFYSSISGELVLVSGSTYAPKVEDGKFLTYTYSSGSWVVKDKSGAVYKFGDTAASRQDDPSDSTKVYKWMLAETRDTNDNYIKYEYYKNSGQIYPDTITYTGNGSTDGIFTVEFTHSSRTDAVTQYLGAFVSTTNYKITEIQTKISNMWVRKYTLSYTTGDNGYKSMLSSITESGQDENSNTSVLPAVEFTYQMATNSGADWISDSNWSTAASTTINTNTAYGTLVADVNGDGLPDLLESWISGIDPYTNWFKGTYLNNGDGTWTEDTNLTPPIRFALNSSNTTEGVHAIDVNGDGLADLVQSFNLGNGLQRVYINKGTYWDLDENWHPTCIFVSWQVADTGCRLIDINGDNLPDFVRAVGGNSGEPPLDIDVFLNNGNGWDDNDDSWGIPVDLRWGVMPVDYNGDGLVDFLQGYKNTTSNPTVSILEAYINNGDKTWSLDTNYTSPVYFSTNYYASSLPVSTGIRLADINGDGLIDILRGSETTDGSYLNTGNGWVFNSYWSFGHGSLPVINDTPLRLGDFDGDGMIDKYDSGNGGASIAKNQHVRADLMETIETQYGGTTDVTYRATPKYVDSSGNLLNPDLPFVLMTVYQTATDPGTSGSTITKTYSYAGGDYYYNSVLDRKYAGFGKVTENTNNAQEVNFYHQGNSTNSSEGEYDDHSSKIGKVYRTETYDASGNLYSKTINKWDKYNQGTGRDFVKLVRTTTMTYDGDSDHKDKTEEYTYDNAYGNITSKVTWGEVNASNDGSFTDTGSDKYTENISYTSNTTDYIVGLPYQDTMVDQNSNKVRETKTYYDGQTLGSVTDGNPTKEERWKSGSVYVNTQKTYNTTYGIVTSSTDERGKTTTYSYDTYNLYPASITNPLSHATSYLYDYSLGKPKQVTDPNSFVYQTVYDGLDRIIAEKIPDTVSPYSPVTKTAYLYTDTSGAVSIKRTDYLDGTNGVDTYQYFDGLNRLIQERKEAETSGQYNVSDTVYNSLGLVQKESLKYASSGSSKTSATTTTTLYNNYTYDSAKRVLTVSNNVGTTTNAYDDWKTTVTDPNGNVKHYYNDAYGNLVQVDEINGVNTYSTLYEWNGNKLLTKITDALGNLRNFTYDGLGRRLTAEDLHASTDGTYGSWSYAYDDAANMTESINPEGQTVNYTYNDINQVLTENYTGDAGTEISYIYGGCTNGTGKLCYTVMSDGADTDYVYDSVGRVASEDKTVDSVSYDTYYEYDRQGNMTWMKYPDNAQVKNLYNNAGLLELVQRKESGGSYVDVVSNFDYNPMGQITLQEDSNGVSTTNTYDATKSYRLTRKLTAIGTGGEEADFFSTPGERLVEPMVDALTSSNEKVSNVAQKEKNTSGFIKNVHDVKAWRKFHEERLNYLRSAKGIPSSALQKAEYAAAQYENFLVEQKYVNEPYGKIRTIRKIEDKVKDLLSMFLPEKVYAYVFGTEDFEECSVLPCSFSSSDAWGGVTTSLDHTGKVAGDDSLKNVVSGEGGAGLVKSGLDTDELWFKIKVYIPSPMNFGPSGYASLAVLEDSSTNKLLWLNIEDWGTVRVTVDGDVLAYTDTGLELVPGAVNTIQLRVKMGTSNGDVDVWLDNDTEGSPDYDGSGTMNIGTNNIDRFQAGLVYTPENGVSTTYHDDVTVDYSFIGGSVPSVSIFQDLNYTYDANGNILQIVDNSETDSSKTTTYTYDDLNRILTATVTGAADGNNSTRTFTYNAIGNISAGPEGTYSYGGSSGTNYANPHAVTSMGSENFSYNKVGNLVSAGDGLPWYSTGGTWTHRKQITIDHTKVSGGSDLNDFPVLVSLTDVSLKTVSNGGAVGKANGGDILFTTSDGLTKLAHEIEKYDGATGTLVAWVKIPTLSYSSDTAFIMYYGNASSSDQQDKTNVWDSSTKGVWHFNNSLNDSTSNGNNATNHSSTNTTGGKIGDARDFTSAGSRASVANTVALKPTSALTVSMWVKRNGAQPTYAKPIWFGQTDDAPWGPYGIEMDGDSNTLTAFKVSSDSTDYYTGASQGLTNTTWFYVAGTYDGSNVKYYINNNLQDTTAASISIGDYDSVNGLGIAADYNGYDKWKGWIDEVRISDVARTQGWLVTEYNNQNSPSTFLSLGEVSGSGTSYTYNYKGQLVGTSLGTSYSYDQNGQRVLKGDGTTITSYPNKYYNDDGTTKTKNIYAGDTLVATIETAGATVTPYYNHTDHLGSVNVTTDDNANMVELLDYYPYGSQRIADGTRTSQRQYIGQDYDEDTELSYLQARYYSGSRGQFTSQDPVFWEVGQTEDGKKVLSNPQLQNSYSYAAGNPIKNKDPEGRIAGVDDAAGFIVGGLVGVGSQLVVGISTGQKPTTSELSGAFVTGGIIGWGAINAPATLGASTAVSAAVLTGTLGGFYGNLTKQAVDISSGNQTNIDYQELHTSTLVTAGTNGAFQKFIPATKIPGYSSGKGNMDAIGRGLQTKISNGTISNMSPMTAVKSAVGSQAADLYRSIAGGITDAIKSTINNK